jgi:fucose permease
VCFAALFLFFETGAEVGFRSWIYTYAITLGLASAAGAAYLNSAFWLAFTAGRLVSIPVATRFGPRQVIPAVACCGLLFAALAAAFPRSSAVLWAATLGLGLCMAPIWPGGFTLAGQAVDLTGRLSSVILLGSSFGAMLLPSVLGRVIELTGARWMMALIAISLGLSFAAFVGMTRHRPSR